jgi:hypothetical protein
LIHGQMGTDTKKACQIAVFWIRFHIWSAFDGGLDPDPGGL